MCLDRTASFKPNKYGYKWVVTDGKNYYSANCDESFQYKKSEWDNAKIVKIWGAMGFPENRGFHIFNHLNEAKESDWQCIVPRVAGRKVILVKVQFKDYITGYGDGLGGYKFKMIVAQKMKIIGKINVE